MIKRVIKKTVEKPAELDIGDLIRPVHEQPMVLSSLFYGRSGTGKTTLACTYPAPILLLDFRERGTDSVYDVKDLYVAEMTDWDQIEPMYWHIHKHPKEYKTIIIDQVSAMQDACQTKVLEEEQKEQMSQRLFGEVSGRMKTWLLKYRDLTDMGINVVFIAHDRESKIETEDEDNQIDPTIGARLMPSIAGTLNGAVKLIGNTFIRERLGPRDPETKKRTRFVEYGLRVGPHATYVTKLRTLKGSDIPPFLVDPSYDKIVALMRHGADKPTTATLPKIKRKVSNG